MPAKASAKKNSPRQSASPAAKHKVEKVMHEFKEGELHSGSSGKTVKNRKQAVAIALNEAREAGASVPTKKASK
ncbi:MAG: DUF6496 domain-containing protein [Acidobacteriota bacterium]